MTDTFVLGGFTAYVLFDGNESDGITSYEGDRRNTTIGRTILRSDHRQPRSSAHRGRSEGKRTGDAGTTQPLTRPPGAEVGVDTLGGTLSFVSDDGTTVESRPSDPDRWGDGRGPPYGRFRVRSSDRSYISTVGIATTEQLDLWRPSHCRVGTGPDGTTVAGDGTWCSLPIDRTVT